MGDAWRTLAVILTVAGLVIPVLAVLWALRQVRRHVRDLEKRYAEVEFIMGNSSGTTEQQRQRELDAMRILTPTTSWLDVKYLHENVQIHLRHAEWSQLTWPALWAGFGLLCSTVGSVIGFYLPTT